EENAGTVSQIAHQVGFRNASHFAKIFKELFGVTPSNFNSELRKTFE
ncbi:helix-turn-helix domain-containing protein, partial [candidate division KSB1 bacterium]|nr:helix-turn-helix domain-containing protein [candidate division KSB1 bacterium]